MFLVKTLQDTILDFVLNDINNFENRCVIAREIKNYEKYPLVHFGELFHTVVRMWILDKMLQRANRKK